MVSTVIEDLSPLISSGKNVIEGIGKIHPYRSGHGGKIPSTDEFVKRKLTFEDVTPMTFLGHRKKVKQEVLAEKKYVRDHLAARDVLIVDARPPVQYSGEEGEEIRKGHIPGARNLFWETTLEGAEVRVWKKKEDLEKLAADVGATRGKEIIVHCRTGREASHVFFTLKYILGFPKVRLYRGSWVEWSADSSLPIRVGTEP
jgi:3-mercaptopyruvate sulfurtransferase SseA